MLTDLRIKTAKPSEKAYKLTDAQGLHVLVQPNGSKLWQFRYRYQGREKTASIGPYPLVSLSDARVCRDKLRLEIRGGDDPVATKRIALEKRLKAEGNAFESVARSWYAQWSKEKTARHAGYTLRRLEANVFPLIGSLPVASITPMQIVRLIKKVSDREAIDLASRIFQICGQVFRFGIAHGLCDRNPTSEIRPSDVLPSRRQSNYARVNQRELPQLMLDIEAYRGTPITRLALKLMALTFVRTSELIQARWSEFDFEAMEWRIPAERMKMNTQHIVPLSSQAIEVLLVLKSLSGTQSLVFPGDRRRSVPMSNNTILKALDRMGYKGRMTGHGFRGIASTVLHEQGFDHMHIEIQLAHQERNRVSAAYNHAQYLEPRRRMMQAWADYLDRCRSPACKHPE